MENTFKSSLFGGFDRDDVIRYIEKTALENKARIEALEKENDGLCHENEELRNEAAAVAAARDRLSAAYGGAIEEQESTKNSLAALSSELEMLHAQLTALETEKSELLARVSALQPQVDEYSAVKAHLSDLELCAHARADELESETHRRLAAQIDACRRQCELALSTLGETCASVSGELRRADAMLSQLPSAFNTLRNDLDELEQLK